MYRKHDIKDVQFVESKGDYGFREVLDDFDNAEYINILTFDISKNGDELINLLKKAGQRGIPITVISNIPQRFDRYFVGDGYDYRKPARKNIKIYERKLNPEDIGILTEVFFMFSNHGKIVMTNNIIYWGSANYSDESKKNYECGVLCKDREFIKYVNEVLFPSITGESLSYYSEEYSICIASIFSFMTYLHNKYEELQDASYGIHEDYDTNFNPVKYFNMYDNYISWEMLRELMETVENAQGIIQQLFSDLEDGEKEFDEDAVSELSDKYEKYMEGQRRSIERMCYHLEDMAKFDEQDYANGLLNGKYAAYSYEENLDYYAQLAFEEGRDVMHGFIEEAQPVIKELLECLKSMDDELIEFVDSIMKIAKVNEKIDNT